jgi:YrbI family 3-deoxy-D-manno-octulosonate 8-phosphate phosphatase
MDPILVRQLANIRALMFRLDGALCDGSIYAGESGALLRRFNSTDIAMMGELAAAGISIVVICEPNAPGSGLETLRRLITHPVMLMRGSSLADVERMLQAENLSWTQVCFMASHPDDVPLVEKCGTSIAVGNADQKLKDACGQSTANPGGCGALAEAARMILDSRAMRGRT